MGDAGRIRSGPRSRWTALTAGVVLELAGGSPYSFPVYAQVSAQPGCTGAATDTRVQPERLSAQALTSICIAATLIFPQLPRALRGELLSCLL